MTATPPILRAAQFQSIPGLVHGFCGRRGGISHGTFADLNLSYRVGDRAPAVDYNWRRLESAVGAGVRCVTMRQVHGTEAVVVSHETGEVDAADALLTRATGIALGILTADCVPILLVAPRHRAVAAIHAGWRGTLGGIVERTLQALSREWNVQPADVYAALGPAIGGCCYEVGRDIVDRLEARWSGVAEAVRPGVASNGTNAMLDLRIANAAILRQLGVGGAGITCVGPCTRCAATDYFSYRAAPDGVTGRQLSFVGWGA